MSFPATTSLPSVDALSKAMGSAYDIDIADCRLHLRSVNDTFRVVTAAHVTHYCRVYTVNWRTRDEITSEHDILHHLQCAGAHVCLPIPANDRSYAIALDCAEGTRWLSLFGAAPGDLVSYRTYTLENARLYGRGAAELHFGMRDYAGSAHRPRLDIDSLLNRPLALVQSHLADRPADRRYLLDLGDRLRSDINARQSLTVGLCHGDLHGQNAALSGRIFTFYDFDFCGWGFRAYELAVLPWVFLLRDSPNDIIERIARAFLEGYHEKMPVSKADLDAIPLFVAIRQIWFMGLQVILAPRRGWSLLDDEFFDRHFARLRRWDADYISNHFVGWLSA